MTLANEWPPYEGDVSSRFAPMFAALFHLRPTFVFSIIPSDIYFWGVGQPGTIELSPLLSSPRLKGGRSIKHRPTPHPHHYSRAQQPWKPGNLAHSLRVVGGA